MEHPSHKVDWSEEVVVVVGGNQTNLQVDASSAVAVDSCEKEDVDNGVPEDRSLNQGLVGPVLRTVVRVHQVPY